MYPRHVVREGMKGGGGKKSMFSHVSDNSHQRSVPSREDQKGIKRDPGLGGMKKNAALGKPRILVGGIHWLRSPTRGLEKIRMDPYSAARKGRFSQVGTRKVEREGSPKYLEKKNTRKKNLQ